MSQRYYINLQYNSSSLSMVAFLNQFALRGSLGALKPHD
jgi:hypothetical protein